jgi:hypothetical protein
VSRRFESITNPGYKLDQHDIRVPTNKPCITTFRNDIVGSIRVPPRPSACHPRDTTRWAIYGWPVYYSDAHISRGMMCYHPTNTIIKLRRFTGPHKSSMRSVHNQMLVQGFTMNGHLNRHKQWLSPERLEYPHTTPCPSHPMILHFSLVVSLGLKFKHHSLLYQILTILNLLEVKKGPTCEWNQPLIFYH